MPVHSRSSAVAPESYLDEGNDDTLHFNGSNNEEDEEEELLEMDELLPEAARMIVESGQASISMLQRRLRIGYTRAGRLIDDMERLSIVGGHEGSKARKILVTLAQLEEILETQDRVNP